MLRSVENNVCSDTTNSYGLVAAPSAPCFHGTHVPTVPMGTLSPGGLCSLRPSTQRVVGLGSQLPGSGPSVLSTRL